MHLIFFLSYKIEIYRKSIIKKETGALRTFLSGDFEFFEITWLFPPKLCVRTPPLFYSLDFYFISVNFNAPISINFVL